MFASADMAVGLHRTKTEPVVCEPGLFAEVRRRIGAEWRLKIALSVILTAGIYGVYLWLQRHVWFQVTILQPARIDRAIPFMPGAVCLYHSVWLLMPIAPWLMTSKHELGRYTAGLVGIAGAAFVVFLFFPTACPRPELPDGHFLYRLLVSVDRELNACPSLHAAFAAYHAACAVAVFARIPRLRRAGGLIVAWAGAIVLSTLLTRQHVIVDALGGMLLGTAGYWLLARQRT